MNKRLLIPSLAVFLCLALLVSAFLIMPKTTQASGPKTPIAVTQPSQCAQLVALYDTQTCIMNVTLLQNSPQTIHVNISYSGVYCYGTCSKPGPVSGVAIAFPNGNALKSANSSFPVVIVAPLSIHGSLTIAFVISGPSNSVKTQLVVTNTCC